MKYLFVLMFFLSGFVSGQIFLFQEYINVVETQFKNLGYVLGKDGYRNTEFKDVGSRGVVASFVYYTGAEMSLVNVFSPDITNGKIATVQNITDRLDRCDFIEKELVSVSYRKREERLGTGYVDVEDRYLFVVNKDNEKCSIMLMNIDVLNKH